MTARLTIVNPIAIPRGDTPTAVAVGFEEDARFSAEVFGCPDIPFAVVPLPFTNGDPPPSRR